MWHLVSSTCGCRRKTSGRAPLSYQDAAQRLRRAVESPPQRRVPLHPQRHRPLGRRPRRASAPRRCVSSWARNFGAGDNWSVHGQGRWLGEPSRGISEWRLEGLSIRSRSGRFEVAVARRGCLHLRCPSRGRYRMSHVVASLRGLGFYSGSISMAFELPPSDRFRDAGNAAKGCGSRLEDPQRRLLSRRRAGGSLKGAGINDSPCWPRRDGMSDTEWSSRMQAIKRPAQCRVHILTIPCGGRIHGLTRRDCSVAVCGGVRVGIEEKRVGE